MLAPADKAVLDGWAAARFSMDQAQQALTIARELNDPALLAGAAPAPTAWRVLAAYYDREAARSTSPRPTASPAIGDRWRSSQILASGAKRDHCG